MGGIPRDYVAKNKNKFTDIDITTGDDSIKVLAQMVAKESDAPMLTFPDGHISISFGKYKVDFSSNFRSDGVAQLGDVARNSMLSELYSRDFTCNTLLMDLGLAKIKDHTGLGLEDIRDKVLRTCLDPEITIPDDPNRIIRAVYLANKLDFTLDKSLMNFIKTNPQLITTVNEKYIQKNMKKSLKYNYGRTLRLLYDLNLLQFINTQGLYV